ncbi:DUF4474 domain-containing protein [Desulfitobacterium sp.]|uniref:DUF4474 domain-containing protein n=1 Tax=Desulfitobacterium sp. TaxID=49981 RepID=UPI002B1F3381|nr:DUF4474 domain-containing protein [Desulfitobacterium sp.]MEA4902017.1 DUF4474 domain-containing protein [Desulfitobacterium sp.]
MSMGNKELDKIIELAGYGYDPAQDIFYSTMNPWQRDVGYCRLYDEAAAPFGMIIDCEPIYFDYQGKKWMIAFWKGQYDLVTGGEIGVYIASHKITLEGVFAGTFYQSVSDEDCLTMAYALKKNGKPLFIRHDKHWWLTGFKLGEFSEPLELTMDIMITLKDLPMRDAFIDGLIKAGYQYTDLWVTDYTVRLIFDIPHTPQPITRTRETDKLIQRKNLLLCEQYQALTNPYNTVPEKIKALEDLSPSMYKKVQKIGKSKKLYEMYTSIVLIGSFLLSRFVGEIEEIN